MGHYRDFYNCGLLARRLGKFTKARKWSRRILQAIQCHDQLAQILCNMALSWCTSCVAPRSCFQVDQSRWEHQIFGFPNWFQHTSGDYDYTSYSLHTTKVNTLEFEKTLASGAHHSGKLGITRNNMVQPIMLDNLQGKYTPDSTIGTQLHLVW